MTSDLHSRLLRVGLAELETFVAVAELKSFTAAAERMHLGQPAVTSRIKKLEASLKTSLLVRNSRHVELTPSGTRLLRKTNETLSGLRELIAEFVHAGGENNSRVVVASTPVLAARVILPIIADYTRRFTDVNVVLIDLKYADVLASLESGNADLAVLTNVVGDRYRVEPLGSEKVVLVVPPRHPYFELAVVGLEQLSQQPLLLIEQYQPLLQQINQSLAAERLAPVRPIFVSQTSTLIGMIEGGMGAGLMIQRLANERHEAGCKLLHIEGLHLGRQLSLVYPRHQDARVSLSSFSNFLRLALLKSWSSEDDERR